MEKLRQQLGTARQDQESKLGTAFLMTSVTSMYAGSGRFCNWKEKLEMLEVFGPI